MSKLFVAAMTCALIASTPWTDAPAARAYGFNPVDYAANLSGSNFFWQNDANTFDLTGNNTVMGWFKPDNTCNTAGECILVNKESSWEFGIRSGTIQYALTNSGGTWAWYDTGITVRTGAWTHIAFAVSRSSNTITVIINGRQVWTYTSATAVPSTGYNSGAAFGIGARQGSGTWYGFFTGSLDEVRIYNTVLNAASVTTAMNTWGPANGSGLTAYWDFNEGQDTYVHNSITSPASGTDVYAYPSSSFSDVKTSTTNNGAVVMTFPKSYLTAVGGWTVPSSVTSVDALVIAGGGGGGNGSDGSGWAGGGGGAGGVIALSGSAVTPGAVIPVTVGGGGLRATSYPNSPYVRTAANGADSSFLSNTAVGGGGGGSNSTASAQNGGNGGSGGGGGTYSGAGGTGTANQGYSGGASIAFCCGAGGGGGAGGAGTNASGTAYTNAAGGNGGIGIQSSITGTATWYAGGGAGRGTKTNGSAQSGGTAVNTDAVIGSGAGGGGGGGGTTGCTGCTAYAVPGHGGNGGVIVRYTPVVPVAVSPTQYSMIFDKTSTANITVQDRASSPLDITNDMTFSTWVNPATKNTNHRTLLVKESSYIIGLANSDNGTCPNKVIFAFYSSSWTWVCPNGGTSLSAGTWWHVTVVKTGGYVYTYINGALDATTTLASPNSTGALATNDNPVIIGGRSSSSEQMYGRMDDVKLWNYSLGATEIAANYQRGAAGNALYFPFDETDVAYGAKTGTNVVVNRAANSGPLYNGTFGAGAILANDSVATTNMTYSGNGMTGFLAGADPFASSPAPTFSISTNPAKGTATVNSTTGRFTYVANPNVSGSDSFIYTVTGENGTATATVSINLTDYATASPKTFSQTADATAAIGVASSLGYSNPATVYTNGESVRAVLSSTSGNLAVTLNGSTLAAGAQNSTSLTIDGTQTQINNALNSATITSSSTSPARVTLTLSMAPTNQTVGGRSWVYNSNGHFYSLFSNGSNFTQPTAMTAANAINLGGRHAYLATIQHAGENSTVQTAIGSVTAWLGGADDAVEGTFRWYGNDTNVVFRTSGANVRSRYVNWASGEPNNGGSGGNEDWTEMNGSAGTWNDCGTACSRQYAALEVDPVSSRVVKNIDFSKSLTASATSARNLGLGATFLGTSAWGTSETITATIAATSGTISYTQGSTTVTAGASGSSTVTFTGTRDIMNTALNTATVTNAAAGTSTVTLTYGVKRQTTGSYAYNAFTDHFYYRNGTGATQSSHTSTAAGTAFGGTSGYLATVTSSEEYATIRGISTSTALSGGTDSTSEQQWTWDSPDAYQIYSDNDQPIGGTFTNWDPGGEPNGDGNYNAMVITYGNPGTLWDDQSMSSSLAAIYEWAPIDTTFTVNVTTSSALSVATPASGLTATFGTPYSLSVTPSNGLSPYTYAVNGSLPAGLSINTSTGVISGTTTTAGASYPVTVTVTDSNSAIVTTSSFSIRAAAPACSPTSSVVGTQTVLQFTSTGYCDWTVPSGVTSVDAFVVGAGGGGGSDGTGGAGGGAATRVDGLAATAGATMTVLVGAGGSGGTFVPYVQPTNGGQSSVQSTSGTGYAANGGTASINGPAQSPGAGGTSTIGFAGGLGGTASGTAGAAGGAGKTGSSNWFTGSALQYGGGGGGGAYNSGSSTIAAAAGASGGGAGCAAQGSIGTNGGDGTANRGGGGGAGCAGTTNAQRTPGGAGGSGIVIIRYATDPLDAFPAAIGSLRSHVTADSFQSLDSARRSWLDTSGNGRSATNFYGSPAVTDITGNGASNSVKTLSGGITTGVRFPAGFLSTGTSTADDYTMFHVARYSGANRNRIFDGVAANWLSGFWCGNAGVAYHNKWFAPNASFGTCSVYSHTNWMLSMDQNNAYRSNSGDISGSTTGAARSDDLAINYGQYYGSEYSDWNVAEVLVFSKVLSAAEIRQVESWLTRKYGLQGVNTAGTRTDPQMPRTVALAKTGTVTTGLSDRLTSTWTLPVDTSGITDFKVEFKESSGSSWSTWAHTASASLTTATITNLTAGTNYDVRVTAVDSGATNRPSATATGVAPWKTSTVSLGAMPASPRSGTAYTLTATVTSGASGTVNFKNNGTSITGCSAVTVSSATATCSWTPSASGSASITADFSGDGSFLASSTSSASTVTVSNALCTTSDTNTGRFKVMRVLATGTCDFTALPSGVESVDVLVIGGGGGAGHNVGSGGAGGGGYYATNVGATNATSLSATVGAGGRGGTNQTPDAGSTLHDGAKGDNSTLSVGATTFTGNGGTGGQTHWINNYCGGTASGWNSSVVSGETGSGTGGTALTSGAGGQGSSASGVAASAGGSGFLSSITGTSTRYAGGGGGGGWGVVGGTGGSSGGGAGNASAADGSAGSAGTANTGGGGGAGAGGCGSGGAGGSGIVIVRYAQVPSISAQPSSVSKNAGQTLTLSVTAAATGAVAGDLTYQWRKGGVDVSGATGSTYTVSGLLMADAGTYSVVVKNYGANAAVSSATSSDAVVTMSKGAQTITFGALPDRTYGDSAFTVSATVSSGLAVTFSSYTPTVCSVTGSTVTILDVGTCTVTATQSGTTDYNAATDVQQSFTVNQKTLTVTGTTASSKVYDRTTAATPDFTSSTLVGVVGTDEVSLVKTGGTATFATKAVGVGKTVTVAGLTLSGAQASRYSLSQPTTTASITAKPLTVTGLVFNNKVYDGLTSAPVNTTAAAFSGIIDGDTVTVDLQGIGTSFGTKSAATGKTVTVIGIGTGGTDGTNYSVTQPTGTADITPKELTVSGVSAGNKIYNSNNVASLSLGSAALVGKVSGDLVSLSTGSASATFANKTVGTGKTVSVAGLSVSGADATNYSLTQPTATADITAKSLTVSGITATNRTYDATNSATSLLVLGSAALSGNVAGDDVTLSTGSATATFANKAVGTGKTVTVAGLTISGTDSGNYSLTQPTTTADITAKALTVSGVIYGNKTYDGNTSADINASSAAFAGIAGSDSVSLGDGSATALFADKTVGTGKTVTVSGITVGGTDAANYTVTQPVGAARITAKTLTVTGITASNRVYDRTASATALLSVGPAVLSGKITGDSVTLSTGSATATFDDKNVGTGKTVTLAGLTISGTDSGNYSLTQPTTTADITAKTLTVSGITAQNKNYDGTTTASLVTGPAAFAGVVAGDDVSVDSSAATGTFSSAAYGTGKTVTVTGVGKSGADAGNYSITQPSGISADISRTTITVSGVTASNKIYDGTTAATINATGAVLSGVQNNETISLLDTGADGVFDNKNVGTNKQVQVRGLSLSGTNAANYTLVQPTATANVTAKTITVSGITAGNKTYDRSTSATSLLVLGTAALSGNVLNDDVTLSTSGAQATFADKNVANGKTVTIAGLTISGGDSGNYSLTQPTTTANITPKALTVTGITANNRVYDGGTTASLNSGSAAFSGILGADDVTIATTSVTGVFTDKNVGTAKTVTVAGVAKSGADAGNYSITQPTATADITQKTATVTGASGVDKTYDRTTSASVNSSSATLADIVSGDAVSLVKAPMATFATRTVGNAKPLTVSGFSISGNDAGNYVLAQPNLTATISTASLSVTGITAAAKTYDATRTASLTTTGATLTGVIGVDDVSLESVNAAGLFSSASAGAGKSVTVSGLTIFGPDSANYSLSQPSGLTATINTKALTISGVSGVNKTYDRTTTATLTGTASLVGVEPGDTVTLGGTASATFASGTVGTAKVITVTGYALGGTSATNYSVAQPTGLTANITTKTLTINGVSGVNKTYDRTTTATLTGTASLIGVESGDTVTLGGTASATFANKSVGTAKAITVTGYALGGTSATNYVLAQPTGLTANITAKTLTVNGISGVNKTYDRTTTATLTGTASLIGKITGDTVTLGGTASGVFADKTVGAGKTITVTGYAVSGADAPNYSLIQPAPTAEITTKAMNITNVTAKHKTYDGDTSATLDGTAALSGKITGDTVTLTGSALATFADKNIGTGKSVSVTGYALDGGDAVNYTLTQPTGLTADITAKELTVTNVTVNGRTYNGTTAAAIDTTNASLVGAVDPSTVTLGGSPTGTFADKNVGSSKPVTVSGFTISGTDAGNYTLTQPTGLTATITVKSITMDRLEVKSKQYDLTTSAGFEDDRVTFNALETGDVVTLDFRNATAVFDTADVGADKTVSVSGTVSLDGADAGNYTLTNFKLAGTGPDTYSPTASSTYVWPKASIVKAKITLGGLVVQGKTYDGTTAVTGTVDATHWTWVGLVPTGHPLYWQTTVNGSTVICDPKVASSSTTITDPSVTSSDACSGSRMGAEFETKSAGTDKTVNISNISITGIDADIYDFVAPTVTTDITPIPLSITGISVASTSRAYDGSRSVTLLESNPQLGTGILDNEVATYKAGSAVGTLDTKNVGNNKTVTVSHLLLEGTDAGNYTITPPTGLTQTITEKDLTVSGTTVSNKTYNAGTTATINSAGSLQGIVGSDVVTLGSGNATASFNDSTVATGKSVTVSGLTLEGAGAGNYSLTQPTGITASITAKELTVTGLLAVDKTYNRSEAAALSGTAALQNVETADIGDVFLNGQATGMFADANVGTDKTVSVTGLSLSGSAAGNYSLTLPTLHASISAANLTVSGLTAENKTYDSTTDATLTGAATLTGVVSGDSILLDGTPVGTFASATAGMQTAVAVDGLSISGANVGNYVLADLTLSADITKAHLTISGLTAADRTYDGTTGATLTGTAGLNSVLTNDTVTLSGAATGSFTDGNVGTAKTVTVSGLSLDGADKDNYVLDTFTLAADITKATLTVTGISAADKTYDQTTDATLTGSGALSGKIGNDVITLEGTPTGSFSSKSAANGKTVTVAGLSISGRDADNYVLAALTVTANISKLQLSVTGITADDKTYDATTDAPLDKSAAVLTGVIDGDTVSLAKALATGSFTNKNIGTGKTVTVSGLGIGGTDAGNYALSQTTTTATITAAELTVTGITAADKTYDGGRTATLGGTAELHGVIGSDVTTLDTNATAVGTFADKRVGTGKTVTITGLAVTGGDAGNYTLTQPASSANITVKTLTVDGITADDKTYDGTDTATLDRTHAAFDGVILNDDLDIDTNGVSGIFPDQNIGTGRTVRISGVAKSGNDAGNYVITQPTTTASITALNLTVTGITAQDKTFDDTTAGTSLLNLSAAALVGKIAGEVVGLVKTGATGTLASKYVGSGIVLQVAGLALNGPDAANYTLTQPSLTVDILRVAPVLTWVDAADITYGTVLGATQLNATANTGGTFVYTPASGSILSAGPHSLSVTFTPTSDQYRTLTMSVSINVNTKELTVAGVSAVNRAYDGTDTATLTGNAALSGTVGSDTVILSTTGAIATFGNKNIGTGKTVTIGGMSISGADSSNYTLTQPSTTANITAVNLSVIGVTAANKEYDADRSATLRISSVALSGAVPGDDVALSTGSAAGTFADKNIGDGKTVTITGMSISGADASNYTLTQPSTTANITAKNLTVNGITASSKEYDGSATATLNKNLAVFIGIVGSDQVTMEKDSIVGTFPDKNIGTGLTVTVTGVAKSGVDAGNYTINQPTATASITAKNLTVAAVTATSKEYNGNDSADLVTTDARFVGVVSGDTVVIEKLNIAGTFPDKNIGVGLTITVTGVAKSGADAGNYTVTQPTGLSADITAKSLTVTGLDVRDKTYDGDKTAVIDDTNAALTGVVGNESVSLSITSASALFASEHAGSGKTVQIRGLVITGSGAGNYVLTQPVTATADVAAAVLTVTGITAADKTYDGNNVATLSTGTAIFAGVLGSDDVSVVRTGIVGTFPDKTIGSARTVTVSGVSKSGADAGNYVITQPTTTATITAKELTVSGITAADKEYDGNITATLSRNSAEFVGIVDGDTVNIGRSGIVGAFPDKTIGSARTVTVSGVSKSGADAGNYVITQPTTTATITAKELTVSGITAADKSFDGNSTATLDRSGAAIVGKVAGEDVVIDTTSATGVFDSANAGSGRTVTISGVTKSGGDAGNYALTQPTTTATITPASSGLAWADPGTITFGTSLSNSELNATANVPGTFAYTPTAGVRMDAGSHQLSVTFTPTSSNYAVSTATVTLDVNQKALTVTAEAEQITYGTQVATLISVVGISSPDSISTAVFTYTGSGSTAYPSSQAAPVTAGTYLATPSSLVMSSGNAANYSVTYEGGSLTINRAAQTTLVAHAVATTLTFSDPTREMTTLSTTGGSGDGAVTFAVTAGAGSVCSVTGNVLTAENAGTCEVTATKAPGTNHLTKSSAAIALTIDKAAQTISLGVITAKTYGDANFSVTTSATSGLNVVIQTSPVSVCDNPSGHTVRIRTNGTCTVTAVQSGDDNYLEAADVQRSFVINRKNLTVSGMTAESRIYDATNEAAALVIPSEGSASLHGIVPGDSVNIDFGAIGATFADKNVGTSKPVTVTGITLSGSESGRYTVSQPSGITADIEQKTIAVSGVTVPTRDYDTTNVATLNFESHSLAGVEDGDAVTLDTTGHAATFANATVGTSKTVTVTGLGVAGTDSANYSLTQPVLQGSITKATAPITYAASRTSVYTGTPRTLATSTTPAGLTVITTYTGTGSTEYAVSQTPPTTVGTYAVSSEIVDVNYEGTSTSTWRITKQTIPVQFDTAALTSVFDGTAHPVEATTTPAGKNVIVTYTGTGTTQYNSTWPPTNAGTYSVTAVIDEHNFAGQTTSPLVISRASQRPVLIAGAPTARYDADTALVATGGSGSGTYSYSILSGPCTVISNTGVLRPNGTGTCTVRADRAGDDNYLAATGTTASLVVSKGSQTVSFTTDPPSLPLVDTTYRPAAASSSGLTAAIDITTGAGTVCVIAGGTVTFKASGMCTITATQAGNSFWSPASPVVQSVEVGKMSQAISFAQPISRTVGSAQFNLGAFSSAGLPVAYSVPAGSTACTVSSDGTVTVGTAGTCTVTASQAGDAVYSMAAAVTREFDVTAGTANAPHIASISSGDGTATIGYSAPSFDGGSPVISYKVSAQAANAPTITRTDCPASPLSCTLVGLLNGQSYIVTVAAVTVAGAGDESEAVEVLVPNPNVDAPVSVVGTRASTTLDLNWEDPANFDPATFQQYEVSIREKDGTFGAPVIVASVRSASSMTRDHESNGSPAVVRTMSVTSRSARFTNLNPTVMYEAKIATLTTTRATATDANTAAALVMPLAVPDAPRGISADSFTEGTVNVSWRVPSSTGGSPLTAYVVSTNRGRCVLPSPVSTRCTVSGLAAGDSLNVFVLARNAIGEGLAVSTTYSLPTVPGAPAISAVSVGITTAAVTWNAPKSDGGRAVTSYAVMATPAAGGDIARCSATTTTCELRNLKPATAYEVKVRAVNSLGAGAWSGPFSAETARPVSTAWAEYRAQTGTSGGTTGTLTLPPAPAKVSAMSVGANRTRITALRRPADTAIPVTTAIISISTKKGGLIARIKVRVDPNSPETSVTVPYASKKVKVEVQFANDYGISAGGPVGVNIAEGNTFDSTVVANQVRVVGTEISPYAYFAKGSSALTKAGKAALAGVATTAKSRGGLVYVSGFATKDELRSTWMVQSLARLRAETVAKQLSRLGVRQWIYFAGTTTPANPWDPARARRVVVSTDTVLNQA